MIFFFSPPPAPEEATPWFPAALQGESWQVLGGRGAGGWISGWGAGLRSAELWLIHFWLRGVTPQCIDKELIPSLARVKTCLPSPLITGLISLSRCHSRGAPPINTNPQDNNRSINPSQRGVMEWNCSACTPGAWTFFQFTSQSSEILSRRLIENADSPADAFVQLLSQLSL